MATRKGSIIYNHLQTEWIPLFLGWLGNFQFNIRIDVCKRKWLWLKSGRNPGKSKLPMHACTLARGYILGSDWFKYMKLWKLCAPKSAILSNKPCFDWDDLIGWCLVGEGWACWRTGSVTGAAHSRSGRTCLTLMSVLKKSLCLYISVWSHVKIHMLLFSCEISLSC